MTSPAFWEPAMHEASVRAVEWATETLDLLVSRSLSGPERTGLFQCCGKRFIDHQVGIWTKPGGTLSASLAGPKTAMMALELSVCSHQTIVACAGRADALISLLAKKTASKSLTIVKAVSGV